MGRLKNAMSWVVVSVIVFGLLYLATRYLIELNNQANRTFNVEPVWYFSVFIYFVVGVLFGLEHLVREIKKDGLWKVNLYKLVFLGVPALYFAIGSMPLTYNVLADFLRILLTYQGLKFFHLSATILGYVIMTSFYKAGSILLESKTRVSS